MKFTESELDNLQMALRYAALLMPGFPVWGVKDGRCLCGGGDDCRPGKHPFGRAVPRGHHDATTDPDLLRQWFSTPFVNVGVNVGKANALVLDPDAKHGGLETLARLEAELGPLPHGPVAVTGGGGRHHWFDACPEITKNLKLPGGIDVLVSGAVIMAPSMHISGKRYGWRVEPETPRPKLPEALREYLVKSQWEQSGNKKAVAVVPAGTRFDPMRGRVTATGTTFDSLGQLPAGERNAAVNSVIGAMLAAGLSADAILAAGLRWAEAQVPSYSESQLRSKVKWFARKHGVTGVGLCDVDDDPLGDDPADEDAAEEEDVALPVAADGLAADPEFLAALEAYAAEEEVPSPGTPAPLPSPTAAAEEKVDDVPAHLLLPPQASSADSSALSVADPDLLLPPQTSSAAAGGPTSSAASSSAAGSDNSNSYLPPTVKPEASSRTMAAGELLLPPPAAPLPPNNPTPVPPVAGLPPAVRHGLFGDYVTAVAPHTEADPMGVLVCCMMAFGSAVGRGPHVRAGGRQRATDNVLLVGFTSDRKGTAQDAGSEPVKLADPVWAKDRVLPGMGSGEGLVHAVRDDAVVQQPIKDKGVIVRYEDLTVPGVADKRLCVVEAEFDKLLTLIRRESSTLSGILLEAWAGKPVGFTNKSSADRCEEPHLTIIGMMPPDELVRKTAGRAETTNGMLNRFLFCRVRKHGSLPFGGDWQGVAAAFAPRFQAALQRARAIGEVGWSAEARTLWRQEYERLSESRAGDFGGVTARRADHTLRLALLYALGDGSGVIRLEHLQAALALYEHCDLTARELYATPQAAAAAATASEVVEEPLHVQLLAVIRRQPGVRRSELTRRFSHTPAAEVQAALDLLRQFDLAFHRVTATAGRQAECWYPADGETADGPTGVGVGCGEDGETAEWPAAEEEGQPHDALGVPPDGPAEVTAAEEEEVQRPDADPLLPPQAGTAEPRPPQSGSASSSAAQPKGGMAAAAVPTATPQPPVKPDHDITFEEALEQVYEDMFK
jgi:hypothetical protein